VQVARHAPAHCAEAGEAHRRRHDQPSLQKVFITCRAFSRAASISASVR